MGYMAILWEYGSARLHATRSEAGGVSVEVAIIVATLAGLAIAIGAIVVSKATGIAEGIPTE
jgi:hypothetical protein